MLLMVRKGAGDEDGVTVLMERMVMMELMVMEMVMMVMVVLLLMVLVTMEMLTEVVIVVLVVGKAMLPCAVVLVVTRRPLEPEEARSAEVRSGSRDDFAARPLGLADFWNVPQEPGLRVPQAQ